MLILLPPSETKRVGGRQPYIAESLAHAPQLREPRAAVRAALEQVSRDEEAAVKALKLGKKNRGERTFNLELDVSGALPAIERYTGVLYDALGPTEMTSEARAWVDSHVAIQSALFGLIYPSDRIPAYRLSASSRLPSVGKPLQRIWALPHRNILSHTGYVVDLRSKEYASLAPLETLGASTTDYIDVVARGADGEVRALNHFNKAAKGALVHRLAETSAEIRNRDDLLAWCDAEGFEMTIGESPRNLRLVTSSNVAATVTR